ncbi:MAG: ABC transporter ATP-binding protein [Desulfobulbus sp.]|jgi:ABC-2 type transport system ATP-binding protein|uniref:ABC transporter ATP-binding protein n=1 Tax=Desulfobulbus sp. TaxID=895 RepID=UPI002842855A|nr:ABC transporter ATP-binding protein [Desulfobulbus sp.]MDR2550383.1 ABC transporter ATP-binding protein [Desulfobulbus sp.]
MTSAIKTSNLGKWYKKGVRGQKIEALVDLNLEVREGEVFGFIGGNGAGKSTTIKILMGLNRPTAGQAFIFDTRIDDPAARDRVGYLSEHPQFYDFLTPLELFRLMGTLRRMEGKRIHQRADELLHLVALADASNRRIKGFSKGMVQRLGIAVALLGDPELLILDEPMSGLDPLGRHLVANIIRELQQQGKTIFFSTHIIPDIETLCDRVGILVRGHQKYAGSIHEALYPQGSRFEITVRMPEQWKVEQSSFARKPLLWQKNVLYRFEIEETEIAATVQAVMDQGGSVATLEPKRRSLEELFLQLSEDSVPNLGDAVPTTVS